jgi:hypothetical protein
VTETGGTETVTVTVTETGGTDTVTVTVTEKNPATLRLPGRPVASA